MHEDTNRPAEAGAPAAAPAAAPASESRAARPFDRYLTPVAVLIGAIIIAGALVYGHAGSGLPGSQQQAQQQAPAVDIAQVKTDGEPFLGDANAPTTIALFFDYQCPFCKQLDQQAMPQILQKYVSTGKTKVVLKDFQFLGQDSITAALFGRALWHVNPQAYPAWFSAMYAAQDQEGDQGFGNLQSIEQLSATIPGIDVSKVVADMNAHKTEYQAAIDADYQEGTSLGVNGTPSVIVGKQLLSGMTPGQFVSSISAELDKELKK